VSVFPIRSEVHGVLLKVYMRRAENIKWWGVMLDLDETVRIVYQLLRELGYRPIIVGTYALILQGWLPPTYIAETKDVDVFVDDPMIVFDERVERRLFMLGLYMGRSEAGGLYVGAEKPIEIMYPIHDFYIPRNLLKYAMVINDVEVLEGHAVIVAKALGGDVRYLASKVKEMNVAVDTNKLYKLLNEVADELEPALRNTVSKRVREFIEVLSS